MKINAFSKPLILLIIFGVISLLFIPVGLNADYKSGVVEGVTATFNQFAEMYGKRDIKGIMSLFADDPDIAAIGLCDKQAAVGSKAIRTLFEKDLSSIEGTIKLPFDILSVDNFGYIAWVTANVYPNAVLKNGSVVKGVKGRLTLVLRRIKGRWQFLQVHFSIPSDVGSSVRDGQLVGKKVP